jgi:hypothetical protein
LVTQYFREAIVFSTNLTLLKFLLIAFGSIIGLNMIFELDLLRLIQAIARTLKLYGSQHKREFI